MWAAYCEDMDLIFLLKQKYTFTLRLTTLANVMCCVKSSVGLTMPRGPASADKESSLNLQASISGGGALSSGTQDNLCRRLISNSTKIPRSQRLHWGLPVVPQPRVGPQQLLDGHPGVSSPHRGGIYNWLHHQTGQQRQETWSGWRSETRHRTSSKNTCESCSRKYQTTFKFTFRQMYSHSKNKSNSMPYSKWIFTCQHQQQGQPQPQTSAASGYSCCSRSRRHQALGQRLDYTWVSRRRAGGRTGTGRGRRKKKLA